MDRKFMRTLAVTLFPIVPILFLYQKLPSQMVININLMGGPDKFVSKPLATFGILALCTLLQVYFYQVKYKSTYSPLYSWGMPIVTNVMMLFMLYYSLAH